MRRLIRVRPKRRSEKHVYARLNEFYSGSSTFKAQATQLCLCKHHRRALISSVLHASGGLEAFDKCATSFIVQHENQNHDAQKEMRVTTNWSHQSEDIRK
jgi:hypothetical protein